MASRGFGDILKENCQPRAALDDKNFIYTSENTCGGTITES